MGLVVLYVVVCCGGCEKEWKKGSGGRFLLGTSYNCFFVLLTWGPGIPGGNLNESRKGQKKEMG